MFAVFAPLRTLWGEGGFGSCILLAVRMGAPFFLFSFL
jgi:hypothetical protein